MRQWVSGFLLLGVLLGLPGSLLIVWQYHLHTDPELIGLHFLALSVGYVAGARVAQRSRRLSRRSLAILGCCFAFAGLVALSIFVPPMPVLLRLLGLAVIGLGSGVLGTSLLYLLQPYFTEAPAAAANLAGMLFGFGCLVSTVVAGSTYFSGSVQIETAILSIAPLVFLAVFSLSKLPLESSRPPVTEQEMNRGQMLRKTRGIAAFLFALLLFFQFGNEWAIAGWLPLFLIHRLGANPVWAIFTLAVYFLSLMVGRLFARPLLRRVNHRKLLLASISVALIGYLILSFTDNMAEACVAIVLIGWGFAPIYSLVAEKLDDRFSYHPGFYNGIFSVAITGAMSAPWLLGFVDAFLGIRFVMLVPAFGSFAVLILTLLIMLEAHLMGGHEDGQKGATGYGGEAAA